MLSVSEALITHQMLPKVGRNEPSTLVILSVSEELVAQLAFPNVHRMDHVLPIEKNFPEKFLLCRRS